MTMTTRMWGNWLNREITRLSPNLCTGTVPLSSAGDNLIVVQIPSDTIKQQAALWTLVLIWGTASYSIPKQVLWMCCIASEQSVQGGQSKPARNKPSGSFHQNSLERAYLIDLTEINQDRQIQVSGMRPLTPCSPPHTVLDLPAVNSACPHSGLSLYWESEQLHQLLPLGRMGKGVQQQCLDNHIGLQMYGWQCMLG